MPVMWCLTHPKIGEREVVAALLERNHHHLIREGQILLADKGFAGTIESVNQTLKGQLGLEHHGGTPAGMFTRIAQRLLATGIWHNWTTDTRNKRSLIA